jgi:hopanoid biosynthesis associated protein HpnK
MKKHSRALALLSLLCGLALFVYLVRNAGLGEIASRVHALGAGFLLILGLSWLRQITRAVAWLRCMTPDERGAGFWAVWRARLAGDALGDLTAAGPLIAEPIKVIALGDRISKAALASSLAVENVAYAASSCVMVMGGTLALLASFALGESLRAASLVAIGAVLTVIVGLAATLVLEIRVVSALGGAFARFIPHAQLSSWVGAKLGHLRELEDYVFGFYARRPADFALVALCEATFHALGVAEVYTTLQLTGDAPGVQQAFILEAVNRVINIVFSFVPAMVGVDEAGSGLLAHTLGLGTAAGVTLAIVRKARMFCWIALGLVFLAGRRRTKGRAAGTNAGAGAGFAMKYLIVNADDFGLTSGVNRAIIEGHQRGIITSTTVMVNMPGFAEAVRLARENPQLGIGLHFNITQGRPVADAAKVRSLLNAQGQFTGTSTTLAVRSLLGRLRTEEIIIELRAQLERALDAGLMLTHVDSHKHAHALPQVFEAVARTLPEYGVGAVRMMLETPRFGGTSLKSAKQSTVGLGVARLCRTNLAACRQSKLVTTDAFFGIAQTGFWTKPWLMDLIAHMPAGVSELMCHPGYADAELTRFETRLHTSRGQELSLLTDPEIKETLEAQGVQLVNFSFLNSPRIKSPSLE